MPPLRSHKLLKKTTRQRVDSWFKRKTPVCAKNDASGCKATNSSTLWIFSIIPASNWALKTWSYNSSFDGSFSSFLTVDFNICFARLKFLASKCEFLSFHTKGIIKRPSISLVVLSNTKLIILRLHSVSTLISSS